MVITGRQAILFAAGLMLGAAAGAWVALAMHSPDAPDRAPSNVAAAQTVAAAPGPTAICPLQPAATAAGRKDGQFEVKSDLSGNTAADIGAFIVIGKEAAASGRPRDAEVAFLMSCRLADKLKGTGSMEAADARYQLGRHYATVALQPGNGANGNELRRRADSLYSDSLKTYVAKYGPAHEKSRFAADGLASLRAPVEQAVASNAPAVSNPPRPQSRPRQQPRPGKVEASPAQPAAPAPLASSRPGPSFDCRKARSVAEKMICADPQLAERDRELGRLHARAKSSAPDALAFRRQNDEEWRRRESSCRDRECLLRWYDERREQLRSDLDEGNEPPQPTAAR
jgi:hypothetical protein